MNNKRTRCDRKLLRQLNTISFLVCEMKVCFVLVCSEESDSVLSEDVFWVLGGFIDFENG